MKTGKHLKEEGISKALSNAENTNSDWTKKAYSFFKSYAKKHKTFMVEDVRTASVKKVPASPSKRAWGGIVRKAALENIVIQIGYRNVKNPKAHMTPASVWESQIYKG